MARFFVPRGNIEGSRGIVVGEELLHLRRVLRLAAGDAITIFDDTGREHDAVICSIGKLSSSKICIGFHSGLWPAARRLRRARGTRWMG